MRAQETSATSDEDFVIQRNCLFISTLEASSPLMPDLAQEPELGATSQYTVRLTPKLDEHLARERNQEP